MGEVMYISLCYILSMGICGIVLVCVCSTLGMISVLVGLENSTELGTVFIARGVGSISGAAISTILFKRFDGNNILCCTLALIFTLLLIIPFNTSVTLLYIYFFFIGLGTSITDTGCQIMTRKIHGKEAGPWLSANTVAFGASAIFVPTIEIISKNVVHQYFIMAGFIGLVILLLAFESNRSYNYNSIDGEFIDSFDDVEKQYRITHITAPEAHFDHVYKYHKILEEKKREKEEQKNNNVHDDINGEMSMNKVKKSSSSSSIHSKLVGNDVDDFIPHYHCEICASVMVFWLVGGNVALTAYLDSYLAETGVIEVRSIPKLLLVLWIAITLGRLLGVKDQLQLSEKNLISHFAGLCITGCFAISLIFIFPRCGSLLWIAIAIFGISNGPTIGYCYDLINRLTYPTEKSMSIVMFGLNCGASLVPYITTWLWKRNGPIALMQIELASTLIPLPLIFLTSALRYEQKKEDSHKMTYKSLEMIDIKKSYVDDDILLD